MSVFRYSSLCVYLLVYVFVASCQNSTIKLLRKNLLRDYDKLARPVQHHRNLTTVKLNFVPRYLFDLDEEKQTVTLHGWLILEWEDEHLKWKSENYNNIQTLTFASHEIWQPDIIVYENIPTKEGDNKDTFAVVTKNGLVTWVPPIIVYSHCSMNLEKFPLDKQYCQITFGSWNHDGTVIDLWVDKDADITRRFLNGNFKWKVIGVNVTREVMHYDCCEEPYVAIIYNFSLQRRESVHRKVVWLPNILALMVALMTFWLPPESTQKLAISSMMMLLLTGLLIYLTYSIQSLPAVSSAVSLIHRSMILIFINIVIELFVINLSRASIHFHPPSFVNNRLSGLLGIILCLPQEMQYSESLREFRSFALEEENVIYKQHAGVGNWRRIAIAIDRVTFILFVPIVLIITYNNS